MGKSLPRYWIGDTDSSILRNITLDVTIEVIVIIANIAPTNSVSHL